MSEMVDSTDGVQVALHDFGGTGPILLMVHATGFHAYCYQPIARRLTDHFHVVAPDLRGHGDSRYPAGTSMNWWNMTADLAAVIKHMGSDVPIQAAGHSVGGATILMSEMLRPGSISRSWLYEPIIIPDMPVDPPTSMSDNARRRRNRFESRDEVFARYSSRPPFSGIDPEALHAYIDHGFADHPDGGLVLKCPGEIEAQIFESAIIGLLPRLAEVDMPATIVGSGDGGLPAQFAPLAADQLPNGELVSWPDNSHFGPFEDPAAAAAQILECLS